MVEIKITLTEIKNVVNELISRFKTAKERINELEDRSIEIIQTKTQREKRRKNPEQSL